MSNMLVMLSISTTPMLGISDTSYPMGCRSSTPPGDMTVLKTGVVVFLLTTAYNIRVYIIISGKQGNLAEF